VLEPTAAGELRRLAVSSSPCAPAAARRERQAQERGGAPASSGIDRRLGKIVQRFWAVIAFFFWLGRGLWNAEATLGELLNRDYGRNKCRFVRRDSEKHPPLPTSRLGGEISPKSATFSESLVPCASRGKMNCRPPA